MDERTIKLSAFNAKAACSKHFNAVVIGKKHTGKSTLIKDILYNVHKQKVPRICVFSGTEESNGFYREFIPDLFIFDDSMVEEKLTQIVESQKKIGMQKQLGECGDDVDSRIVVVLDDVGYKKNTLKCEILRQIFMNGRHHQISLIVACQYCMDLAIDLRTNADYVFVLKQNNMNSIKNLHETYFGSFEKKKDFQTVLEACTADYQCLVLDNTKPSTNTTDVCFWYKAKYGKEYKFGCPLLWEYHGRWYMSEKQRYQSQQKTKPSRSRTGTHQQQLVVHKATSGPAGNAAAGNAAAGTAGTAE
ncbi:FirrV-1-A12 [Feldmannia irregularis virus a]|uniref:FirrV-1-A12 n=1 Tax=Feldmannia irregularis virus a TaxID=231992 RepID=Q6XM75_9PHYC|nr:FirrV-1-A12 [Feldmannia irregularis virus a]AAR26836.1 FirrV-1-A12 [Feldmannia irregularis virus a]